MFPGTVRDYWVYVPKQVEKAKRGGVMVFQDGGNYIEREGDGSGCRTCSTT